MVILRVKRAAQLIFGCKVPANVTIAEATKTIVKIYNGILKVNRLIYEVEKLIEYGISLPPEMQRLSVERIAKLKLVDEWTPKCEPLGGFVINEDPLARRNGHMPKQAQKDIFVKVIENAKKTVSMKLIREGKYISVEDICNTLDEFRGAVMTVYPNGIPPYDPVSMELHNIENLRGTYDSLEVIEADEAVIYFANKQLDMDLLVQDCLGRHEKSSFTVKLVRCYEAAAAITPLAMPEESVKQQELEKLAQGDNNHKDNANLAGANATSSWDDVD